LDEFLKLETTDTKATGKRSLGSATTSSDGKVAYCVTPPVILQHVGKYEDQENEVRVSFSVVTIQGNGQVVKVNKFGSWGGVGDGSGEWEERLEKHLTKVPARLRDAGITISSMLLPGARAK